LEVNDLIRVRFHGRGGQGVKTASRILGTAAFLEDYYVQDAPLYGAERRGAPIVAFTRLCKEPILERGTILNPDIIVAADETLLDDPAANVLQGIREGGILFINTHAKASHIIEKYNLPRCEVIALDVTDATLRAVGKPAVSAAVAACTCKVTGVVGEKAMLEAIRKELTSIGLKVETVDRNIIAALECYNNIPEVHIETARFRPANSQRVIPVEYHNAETGIPIIYAEGSTATKKTGSWRLFKPSINYEACIRCNICFARCPDGCISLDEEGYPVIEYTNCKGCLICYEECPAKAIETSREVKAW
jgi:pyruvate ferredoxin oxidoreductase gamma subunit